MDVVGQDAVQGFKRKTLLVDPDPVRFGRVVVTARRSKTVTQAGVANDAALVALVAVPGELAVGG